MKGRVLDLTTAMFSLAQDQCSPHSDQKEINHLRWNGTALRSWPCPQVPATVKNHPALAGSRTHIQRSETYILSRKSVIIPWLVYRIILRQILVLITVRIKEHFNHLNCFLCMC